MKPIKIYFIIAIVISLICLLSGPGYTQSTRYTQSNSNFITDDTDDFIIEVEKNYEKAKVSSDEEADKLLDADEETNKITPGRRNETDKKYFKKLGHFDYLWKSVLFPGFGQFVLGRKVKAIVIYSSFVGSGVLGLYYHSEAEDTYQKYLKGEETKEVTQLYDDYLLQNKTSNTFFYIALGIWVYNIIDIVLDVNWENKNIIEDNKVAVDLNEKKVYFYVYKKSF